MSPLPRLRAIVALTVLAALPFTHAPGVSAAPPEPVRDLRAAVRNDLGMSWEEYLDAGRRAAQASELDRQLAGEPGYQGVALAGDEVILTGSGHQIDRAATADGVRAEAADDRLDETILRERYTRQVDAPARGLFGVGWTGDGWILTVADPNAAGVLADGSPGISPQQFAARHRQVTIRSGTLASPQADVLAGQGWGTGVIMPRCSIGFAAFGPDGRQAMLTAGHCTNEGTITEATWEADANVALGRLAYHQFGGPGNSTNTAGSPGTDLSAYAGASEDLRAAVESYAGQHRITGVAGPVVGAPVCTSGRTTRRWQCSTIESVGPYAVQGPRGSADLRWVQGFTTRMTTLAGDSGSGMVTGLQAIGILSAGGNYSGVEYSFGAGLDPVLAAGYSLEVWLHPPRAQAADGGVLRGVVAVDDQLPAGAVVRFEGATARTAAISPDGGFSMSAPAEPGRLVVTSGASRSAAVEYDPRFGTTAGPLACGLRADGCFQAFSEGFVYSSPTTGTHLVKGAIYEGWAGQGWENGWLGYPTVSEMCGLVGGGCWQTFQGGRMYWSPASGAFGIRGAIGESWNSTGYEHGQLGYPISGEFCGLRDGGCFQRFTGGSAYWSPNTGAHPVWGAIGEHWASSGWELGRFGYPIARETCGAVAGERTCTQRFAGGTITWTPTRGASG